MNTPTPTPRTDAATALTSQHRYDDGFGDPEFGWVTASFARELERELTALTAERDQLKEKAKDDFEMFHGLRMKLTAACGDPYKMHDEALDGIISERDQLRATIAEMPTCRCGMSTDDQCELTAKLGAATAERDQLRAALAIGQDNCDDAYDELATDCAELRADVVRLTARAERAEAAQTVALANWNGALERAMKVEAELAAERARLDDLVADLNDACITLASAKDDCDDYAMQNTALKLEAVREVLLQYIPNAAMKGGAK